MSYLNSILRVVFDGILFPFRGLPPLVGLVVVSLVAAIGMLLVFKATSNQDRLAAVKRSIHGCLFEIRLFNDDLRAIMRAQASGARALRRPISRAPSGPTGIRRKGVGSSRHARIASTTIIGSWGSSSTPILRASHRGCRCA